MSKITNDGLAGSGTRCLVAVSTRQQWVGVKGLSETTVMSSVTTELSCMQSYDDKMTSSSEHLDCSVHSDDKIHSVENVLYNFSSVVDGILITISFFLSFISPRQNILVWMLERDTKQSSSSMSRLNVQS